ncbi:ATP-binding cassette domain-containing protein [Candidatus Sulfidibacterium hydrothermale]|uniref:ABC transporter ATP-binding protein n=1 Tax=Candidatus Sulfidibacterium hydrothermale TaxID=2875962 RepID=UPI001F0B2924|nr:ATP-binding cassette domain-containing protein [Candidatus Sulfidibacterium hydrothermale]UBM62890.1 ATP-binding cassette domain-containing protein [Candidatus Sulfidibacterium hydrothermale]
MQNTILKINGLSKSYGRLKALDNLTLTVEKGNVYGILGPNGSGKTTTLGILLDIIKPDSGSFRWFGQDPDARLRRRIGALLEQPLFYPTLSAVDNLKIVADIRRVPYNQIDQVLEQTGMGEKKLYKYSTFSLGMKQRLAIAAALLGNPEVLILDEPTNGLDPRGIADIRNLIIRIARQGTTIILASHLLDEVEKVCTHVLVLEKGKKRYAGPVKEALGKANIMEVAASLPEELHQALQTIPEIKSIVQKNEKFVIETEEQLTPDRLNKMLAEKNIFLTHLTEQQKTLENYFLELLSDKS